MPTPSPQTFEDVKLVLLAPWGTGALVVAAVAATLALALSAWSYRRQRWPARIALTLLRALALAAVVALVLEPALQLRSVTRLPNHIAVVVDRSLSMSIRDKPGGPTRSERAAAMLVRSRQRIAKWQRTRVVDRFVFGQRLHAIGDSASVGPGRDGATRVRAALAGLRRRFRGDDLAGVVLISDGRDNGRFGSGKLSQPSLRFLRRFGAPIHTVWIGKRAVRDVAVTTLFADDFAFVRNAVKVEADITVSGVDIKTVPVTLTRSGRVLAKRVVKVVPGRQRYRVRFEFVPQRVGKFVFTVKTPTFPGEALAHNNQRSFLVNVIRDRVRVLQICGRPSWDERFLRRLLKRDPNVDLISFFILRTPTSLALVPPSELSLIPFPTEELFRKELGSFDLVILQNFNYGPYGIGVYLPALRRYVERGGALAMIGGDLSFSSGGYFGTPIGHVLPVRLLPPSGSRSRLVSEASFRLALTRAGRDHPILQVGATRRETIKLIKGLPKLAGVNRVAGAAAGATVLAAHPRLRTAAGRPMPVLATREVQRGRTLALTTDSSWHWAFKSIGGGGSRRAYDRFWRGAIRWLIRDPELKYVRVIVGRSSVRRGGTQRVTIRVYQPDYRPAANIDVAYEVQPPAGSKGKGVARTVKTNSQGEVRLSLKPAVVGAWRVKASATVGGRRAREQELFLVEPAGPELRDATANEQLLRQIAKATGGRYLGRAEALPDLSLRPPRVLQVNWRRDIELWSRWWWLVGALALLGAEWALRRRLGHI